MHLSSKLPLSKQRSFVWSPCTWKLTTLVVHLCISYPSALQFLRLELPSALQMWAIWIYVSLCSKFSLFAFSLPTESCSEVFSKTRDSNSLPERKELIAMSIYMCLHQALISHTHYFAVIGHKLRLPYSHPLTWVLSHPLELSLLMGRLMQLPFVLQIFVGVCVLLLISEESALLGKTHIC